MIIFLHGGIDADEKKFCGVKDKENHFTCQKMIHIIAAPIKLGWDWEPKKVIDIIEDIKKI